MKIILLSFFYLCVFTLYLSPNEMTLNNNNYSFLIKNDLSLYSENNYMNMLTSKRNIGIGLFIPGVILNTIFTPIWIYWAIWSYGGSCLAAGPAFLSIIGLIMVIIGIPIWVYFHTERNKYNDNGLESKRVKLILQITY